MKLGLQQARLAFRFFTLTPFTIVLTAGRRATPKMRVSSFLRTFSARPFPNNPLSGFSSRDLMTLAEFKERFENQPGRKQFLEALEKIKRRLTRREYRAMKKLAA